MAAPLMCRLGCGNLANPHWELPDMLTGHDISIIYRLGGGIGSSISHCI